MLLGVALQVHKPRCKQAALLASLAVPIAIAVGEALAGIYRLSGTAPFSLAILLVAVLHPAARQLLSAPRWNLPMAGLVAVAAVPWFAYAAGIGTAADSRSRRAVTDL